MNMMTPQPSLPPGFRFHPTDEELVLHYLRRKVASAPLPISIIAEVDIYKFDPWDLPPKAAFGEKEWYFFSPRDRKYPNGARPNRAAASGYWKATGTDKVIVSPSCKSTQGRHINVGVKKALVFYKGRPPRGMKTNWIMHEYRLAESSAYRAVKVKNLPMRLDDWVLCRIYKKSNTASPAILSVAVAASIEQDQDEDYNHRDHRQSTTLESSLKSDVISGHDNNSLVPQKSSSFSNLLDAMDYTMINNILSDTNKLSSPAGFPPTSSSSLDNDNNYPNVYYQPQLIGSDDVGAGIFTTGNSGQKGQHSWLDAGTSWSSSMCQLKRLIGHPEIVPQQMNSFNFDHSLLKQPSLLNPNYCGSFPR